MKLSGHFCKFAEKQNEWRSGESRGLGAIREIFPNTEKMGISRVGRIVEGNRESFIVFTLLFIKGNEVQAKLRYVRLLLIWVGNPVRSGA